MFWWVHINRGGVAYVQHVHYIIDAVLASPKTVQLKAWRDVLSCSLVKERLVRVAINEVHYIAKWSVSMLLLYPIFYAAWDDFRGLQTAFIKLGGLRSQIDALFLKPSASAPSHVQIIIEMLFLQSPDIVLCDLDRANIFVSVSSTCFGCKCMQIIMQT